MINLHDLIDNLLQEKVYSPDFNKPISKKIKNVSDWVLSKCYEAVCFDLGDINGLQTFKIIPELFKIPYPVTWLETKTVDNGIMGFLATEVGENLWHIALLNKYKRIAWQLVYVLEISIENNELKCVGIANGQENETKKEAFLYAHQMISCFASILMAINCSNVKQVKNDPPKFLNLKRQKKNKTPLFSYYTLEIPGAEAKPESTKGFHSSPRLHLRRGHIRQCFSGKYVWVQACLVGNKELGQIEKNYFVKKETYERPLLLT